METILEINNLTYKKILNNITFSLEKETFNILIGKNSSGKTTLVNCIRNIVKYNGNITIFGKSNKINKTFNEIGFFLEDNIVLEDIVFEELLYCLINLGYTVDEAKKQIYLVSKKLDIIDLLYKELNQLTHAELTLISFVFSIIHSPKLLIIDNELENLNYRLKLKIINYIKKQKNLTVLFITNNSDYFSLADKLLFINDGEIILEGVLEQLINKEKEFIKCGSKLPFAIDLSNKLIMYNLLNDIETDIEAMVMQIWK